MYMRGLFVERSHRAEEAHYRAIPLIRDCIDLLGIRDDFSCRWGMGDYRRYIYNGISEDYFWEGSSH